MAGMWHQLVSRQRNRGSRVDGRGAGTERTPAPSPAACPPFSPARWLIEHYHPPMCMHPALALVCNRLAQPRRKAFLPEFSGRHSCLYAWCRVSAVGRRRPAAAAPSVALTALLTAAVELQRAACGPAAAAAASSCSAAVPLAVPTLSPAAVRRQSIKLLQRRCIYSRS